MHGLVPRSALRAPRLKSFPQQCPAPEGLQADEQEEEFLVAEARPAEAERNGSHRDRRKDKTAAAKRDGDQKGDRPDAHPRNPTWRTWSGSAAGAAASARWANGAVRSRRGAARRSIRRPAMQP